MEIKKTSKASLENKKSSWLLVGYVIVLVFMFVAFEWSKRDVRIDMSGAITEKVFEQEIEIPITEQPELVAPPPPQAPAIAEVLTIVDDNDNVKETAIASSEEIGEAVIIKPISPTVDEEITLWRQVESGHWHVCYCNLNITGTVNLQRTGLPRCSPGFHLGMVEITRIASLSR